jgi:hypothetical protein
VVQFWAKWCLRFLDFGHFAVGSFGIFCGGLKNKLLDHAGEFRRMGSISTLFWYLDFRTNPARLSRARADKRAVSRSGQEVEAERIQ